MGQTLEIEGGLEVRLGDPFLLLKDFSSIIKSAQGRDFTQLLGIPNATMDDRPYSSQEWEVVKQQANTLLQENPRSLTQDARVLLTYIAHDGNFPVEPAKVRPSPFRKS